MILGLFWSLMFPLKPRTNELYFCSFQDDTLDKVQFPYKDPIISVAAAPEGLWVLTLEGHIYMRTGMNRTLEGSGWKELNLDQLRSSNVTLSNISISSDSAWGVDTRGAVWLRLGPVNSSNESLPVWIPVDGGITPRVDIFKKKFKEKVPTFFNCYAGFRNNNYFSGLYQSFLISLGAYCLGNRQRAQRLHERGYFSRS